MTDHGWAVERREHREQIAALEASLKLAQEAAQIERQRADVAEASARQAWRIATAR